MAEDGILGKVDWAKVVLDEYRQGASDSEVAAALNITVKKFYKSIQDSSAFAELVEFGRTLSLAFWEGLARKNVANKSFNTPLWTFYMKNKHGWADKTEATTTNENVNTDMDALKEHLAKQTEAFLDRYSPEKTDAKKVLRELQKSE